MIWRRKTPEKPKHVDTEPARTLWKCPRCLHDLKASQLEWRCKTPCVEAESAQKFSFKASFTGDTKYISEPHEQSYPCPFSSCDHRLRYPYPFFSSDQKCKLPLKIPLGLGAKNVSHVSLFSADGNQTVLRDAFNIIASSFKQTCRSKSLQSITSSIDDSLNIANTDQPLHLEGKPFKLQASKNFSEGWPQLTFVHQIPIYYEDQEQPVVADEAEGICPHLRSYLGREHVMRSDDAVLCLKAADILDSDWRKTARDNLQSLRPQPSGHRPRLWVLIIGQESLLRQMGSSPSINKWFETTESNKRQPVIDKYILEVCRVNELIKGIRESFLEVRGLLGPATAESTFVNNLGGCQLLISNTMLPKTPP